MGFANDFDACGNNCAGFCFGFNLCKSRFRYQSLPAGNDGSDDIHSFPDGYVALSAAHLDANPVCGTHQASHFYALPHGYPVRISPTLLDYDCHPAWVMLQFLIRIKSIIRWI